MEGERELGFKHVLIRDVAYGMLPKAVRSRRHFEVGAFLERAPIARPRCWPCSPTTTAAPPRSAREGGVQGPSSSRCAGMPCASSKEAQRRRRLYSNREAAEHYRHARDVARQDRELGATTEWRPSP